MESNNQQPYMAPYSIVSTPDGIFYIMKDDGAGPQIFNTKTSQQGAEELCIRLINNWMSEIDLDL
tara:strand:+ start:1696 stop:1890 length:195 start_codon:yes stop_codon:yes gene_type:complete